MKKFLSLLLTALMLLSMVSCAKDGGDALTWQEQYDLGLRYLESGDYEDAVLAFTAAIEIDPKQPDAYVGRGNAYLFSGETSDNMASALADYLAAIEADSSSAQAYLGLADIYIRQRDYDKVLAMLKDALSKTGNAPAIADKIAEIENGSFVDAFGNPRRQTRYEQGALAWTHEFIYGSNGVCIQKISYAPDGTETGSILCTYDAAGLSLNDAWYYADDGIFRLMTCENSSDGLYRVSTRYETGGSIDSIWRDTYDAYDNLIGRERYDADGALLYKESTATNDRGLRTRQDIYAADGTTIQQYTIFEYNAANQMVKTTDYMSDGSLYGYWIYDYDNAGNISRSSYYNDKGELVSQVN